MQPSRTLTVMTAGLLRQRATEFRGNTRDAFNMAADYISAAMPIPAELYSIIEQALSFTQDRYGK